MTEAIGGPDWVLLGVPMPDGGYAVYASTALSRAALEAEVQQDDPLWHRSPYDRVNPPKSFRLTADMKRFVVAHGATYAEALQRVLAAWTPDQREQITGRRALPR